MDSFRIIVLALILCSVAAIPGSAMVTNGVCSGEQVYVGDTCIAPGFRLSDSQTYVAFKIEDVDDSVPPYQAWIKISSYWDEAGVFGYSEIGLQVGNTYTYYNPSDSNDFVRFTIDSIIGGGDIHAVEFGNIDYQQTSYVGSGGSDSNSGKDTSHKWATIQHATSVLTDGEDVIVGTGTYILFHDTSSRFTISGVQNSPIIFKTDGSHPQVNSGTSGLGTGTVLNFGSSVDYIDISGFNIFETREPAYPGDVGYGAFYCGAGTIGEDSNNVYIHDNIITSLYSKGFKCEAGLTDYNNWKIYDNTINGNIGFSFGADSGVSNNIYNNTILTNTSGSFGANWYPYISSFGNYWSLYTGIDANGDKIGDTPMELGTNDDNYPKMDRESGYVKYSNGSVVSGAAVSQIGATYRNTTSDANGYYALSTIGRDTVTLFAQKGAAFGNATVTYDATNANITIGTSGYNNTNTIRFSSDVNPANEINHSAINAYFWANVWIEDYDPEHDYYSLRVYYPNGDLKDPDAGISDAQPAQVQYKINSNEDYGSYMFISHSYYFDEDLANNTILIHNASDINDSVHNCDCIDHCTPGYFVSTHFCINPYADYASMYISSDLSGLNKITSAYFNHTVYLQISHPNGDYTNYSYNISILKPDNSPFYNWTTTTEYGYASWYTPSIATGTWTTNFIRKNLTDSSELVMNTTSLYLSDEGTPPPVNLSSISGYVREAGSLNAIYQASVVAGSYSASTNAMGYYNLTSMLNGNYTVTASKTGYNSSSINKTINNASFTNVNFLLNCTGACPTPTPTPTGTPTGSPTPTPTGTGGGITPGSTTDADIATMFWTMLFLVLVLYIIAFFWTIGDKE